MDSLSSGEALPIKFQEHLQLQALGINAASIGFNTLTFESDRFICVREKVGEQHQVVVIDLNDPENVMRRPITADSAIMNPDSKIIALKAGQQVQIFDLEKKAKIKSYLMSEEVVYWRWLGPATLGMVTESCVYHWNLEGSDDPRKAFDRHASLNGCQIINYRTDSTGRWLLLIGISAQGGRVVGSMQLYNVDRGVSQAIEGHTGTFTEFTAEDGAHPTKLFVFGVRSATAAKLHLVEIDHRDGSIPYAKKAIEIPFPPEAASDFPVAIQIGQKYGVVYLVTKFGFIHIFDIITGELIFSNRISSETVFVTTELRPQSGIIGVNRKGQVLSVTVDENNIVPYLLAHGHADIAITMAYKSDLPGAEDLFLTRFAQLVHAGDFVEAAKVAARSPKGILRTPQTIETLKSVAVSPSQANPLLQYFGILLEHGTLNHHESIELAKPVLSQNKKALLEKWLKENKLECSEELGDIVLPFDATLALHIYLHADAPAKVCQCFVELGQFSKLVLYAKKVGYQLDYVPLLQRSMEVDPVKAVEFGKLLLEDPSLGVNAEAVFDLFVSQGLVQQATSAILDILKRNTDEVAHLQTKVLLVSIQQGPQVADAIFQAKLFNRYDKNEVGHACEAAGLYQRALEHYHEADDIVRILSGAGDVNIEEVPAHNVVAALQTLMAQNGDRFTPLLIATGIRLADRIPSEFILDIFEDSRNYEGMYSYAGSLVATSKDPKVHFAYIKSAARTGHLKELEKACKESGAYDPQTVWSFLKEEQLQDQLPLIIVADRFNLVHDLIIHLYRQNMHKFIEVYVQKVNPSRTPEVIAALLDADCGDDIIQNLLVSVPPRFSLDDLAQVLEERDRLPLLLPFLEQKIRQENSRETTVYNSLAKIYVVTKQNAAQFLAENALYNPAVVGKFCEKRDPNLALIAYEKGKLDKEYIQVTNDNGLFKHQAKYLVKRRDPTLWKQALAPSNLHRGDLLDQVVNVAVVETQDAEDITTTVKALTSADLTKELASMLEKILYGTTAFANNRNLQNLLIQTSIKTHPDRVMDHLKRLSQYDGNEVAKVCLKAGLFEEAFFAYKKSGDMVGAMGILVENIRDFDRAQAFGEDCNQPAVWSKLGHGLRVGGRPKAAIDAYIRAEDACDATELIRVASEAGIYEELLGYLQMVRKKNRDPLVENEMLFALASLNRLADIEEFLSRPHGAQIQVAADRCYRARLFEAARILYSAISNYAKLATTLVHLHDYNGAVECAKRANSLRVWADVNQACLETAEYHLAQVCGLHLVIHPDELEGLIYQYESQGLYEQCLALLEASLGLDRAHVGIFTELALQYARHRPDRLGEFIKVYGAKVNFGKVLNACQESHLWSDVVLLLLQHDENERALNTMIEHPEAWAHDLACKAIQRISSPDSILRAVRFYLSVAPLQVGDLLTLVGARVDPTRIVEVFKQANLIPLIRTYLLAVQPTHSHIVNTTLNDLLVEEEDYEGLRASLTRSDKFDRPALAKRLAHHDLMPFRKLAAHLLAMDRHYAEAVHLLLKEELYTEAIAVAAESRSPQVSEELISFLASSGRLHLFLAACYACSDAVTADIVMETAWRVGWSEAAVPFVCHAMRDAASQVNTPTLRTK